MTHSWTYPPATRPPNWIAIRGIFATNETFDLANTRIFVGRSKTAAGLREIRILPILHDILAAHKARPAAGGPDALAFPTGTGGRRDRSNLRERVLAEVFERADQLLRERGELPLPKGLSPHKLRHTFASILVALGTDPAQVMRQIGHRSAAFTLDVYTLMMACSPEQRVDRDEVEPPGVGEDLTEQRL